jgi:hypothetical protein
MQAAMGVAAPDRRPKEVLGLALLWFYGVLGWCSLLALIAHADIRQVFWRDLVVCTIIGFAAAHTIRKSGLLALAAGVHSHTQPTRARAWWCWLTRFKLSAAVLVVSGVASWFAFSRLLMWLVEPEARAWGVTFLVAPPRVYFSTVHGLLKTKLLLAVGFAGLAVVPALASDTWRLLTPLMSARAARLRFVFAFTTGVVIVAAVLWFRYYANDVWQFWAALAPQDVEL